MKQIAILTLVIIALFACATVPNPGFTCYESLKQRPDFQAISTKVALGNTSDQTFQMLSDTSRPTDTEKQIIAAWVAARQQCAKLTQDHTAAYGPTLAVPILRSLVSSLLSATADLYNGQLTYGEYAKRRAQIVSEFEKQWAAVRANALSSMPASTTTNCFTFGAQTTCTSH